MLVKIPLSWLREYCEIPWSPEELADRLTMSLLEVDDVTTVGLDYDSIVVGDVKSVERHPNADRLSLCTVDIGDETLEIVCGAPNVAAGQRVPVALVGARVAGDVKIKKSKIRGVVSRGMICSEAELNLSDESDGIMVLDSDSPVGTSLIEVLGERETVLTVDVGTNRPDCLALTGVAREVVALTGARVRMPSDAVNETGTSVDELASVTVADHTDCLRFVGRVISGVRIGPSPSWMVRRLEAAGIRTINNVVDVTNYVMLEMGQPLHAYDLDTLAGHEIIVRRAEDGASFTTLDGVERTLKAEILMIADRERNIGVAGVMGGLNTEITDDTTNVFLEGACFDAVRVRRGSKFLGLSTDASQRFERGLDPELQGYAVDRAAQLIAELGDGENAVGRIDVRAPSQPTRTVPLRIDRVNQILGTEIGKDQVVSFLESLDFTVRENGDLSVSVPSFRRDITREADLIEEVARLYGYDKLEPVMSTPSPIDFQKVDEAHQQRLRQQHWLDDVLANLRNALTGCGVTEVMTHSFSNSDDLKCVDGDLAPVAVENPISGEYAVMRTSLTANVLNLVRWNGNRKARNIRVFELGRVFRPREGQPLPQESLQLCVALTGNRLDSHWSHVEEPLDFFDLKGVVEFTLERFPLDKVHSVPYDESHRIYDPDGAAALIFDDKQVGTYGIVSQAVLDYFDIQEPVWLYTLDCDYLLGLAAVERSYHALPKYPAVERDLALVVSEDLDHQSIADVLWESCGALLESIDLFDVYRGKQVPAGKKSLAYALRYRASDRTLTDDEVTSVQDIAISRLSDLHQAKLR